jgi:hypothetical protein
MAEVAKESGDVSVTQNLSTKRKKIEISNLDNEHAVAVEAVAVEAKEVNESLTKTPHTKKR